MNHVFMNLAVHLKENGISMSCYLCKNILSVGPLMKLFGCGAWVKCGRCKNVKIQSEERSLSIEKMMKKNLLPCIYSGCNVKLIWDEVESHEKTCYKKIITCPMMNCLTPVRQRMFGQHLNRFHKEQCNVGSVEVVLTIGGLNMSFITYDKQYFIVMLRQIVDTPEICIVTLNDVADNYVYNLRLYDGNKNNDYSILIENMPIYMYDEREHCFMCWIRRCRLDHHPYSNVHSNGREMKCHSIDSVKIEALFGLFNRVKYFIEICFKVGYERIDDEGENDCDVDSCGVLSKTDFECSSDILREQLQCPICLRYMLRNIYICEVGHVICDLCKKKVTQCPVCRGQLSDLRNLPLEDLAGEVTLACQNYMRGCDVTDKLAGLSIHDRQCTCDSQ